MTQKELHNQRLFQEAERAVMRMHTRRHFLKESAMGLGALALGSFLEAAGIPRAVTMWCSIRRIRSCQSCHLFRGMLKV